MVSDILGSFYPTDVCVNFSGEFGFKYVIVL